MLVLHITTEEKAEWTTWKISRDEVRFVSDAEVVYVKL